MHLNYVSACEAEVYRGACLNHVQQKGAMRCNGCVIRAHWGHKPGECYDKRLDEGFMQLTRFTDYGLRTLIYLCALPSERLASIDEVCEAFDLSRNHVTKIVHKLGTEGYITTLRGKGGGIRLALPPATINLGDVVRSLEPNMLPVNCYEPHQCTLLPACDLKHIFSEAMEAFMNELDKHTLEDLVNPKKVIRLVGLR